MKISFLFLNAIYNKEQLSIYHPNVLKKKSCPKKKKKNNCMKPMCTCTWAFLSIKKKYIPIHFSLNFEDKTF